jgi:hypothetical protein
MKDAIYLMLSVFIFLSGIWFVDGCERLRRIGK